MTRQTIRDQAEHYAHNHPAKTLFLGVVMPVLAWLVFVNPFGGS